MNNRKTVIVVLLFTSLLLLPGYAFSQRNPGWDDLAAAQRYEDKKEFPLALDYYNRAIQSANNELDGSRLHIDDEARAYMLLGLGYFGSATTNMNRPSLSERDIEYIFNELDSAERAIRRVLYLQYKDITVEQKQHRIWRGRTSRAHKTYASILLYLGDSKKAENELKEALYLDPNYESAQYLLGELNHELGKDIDDIQSNLKSSRAPDSSRAKEYLVEITSLLFGRYSKLITMAAEDLQILK